MQKALPKENTDGLSLPENEPAAKESIPVFPIGVGNGAGMLGGNRGSAKSDVLGDVIEWLGVADLSDDELSPGNAAVEGDIRRWSVAGKPLHYLLAEPHMQLAPGTMPRVGPERLASSSSTAHPHHPPPIAPPKAPPEPPPPFAAASRAAASYCGIADEPRPGPAVEPEEEEWDARQQQTGAAGRLVIYEVGDRPRDDVLLRGGGGRRIMVAAVTDGGKASQAGVKAGDVLVSINGSKEFKSKTADVVHASLVAPVMLVFLGFVGKLQAEVRLNYKQKLPGLSCQHQVLYGRPENPVQVIDQVVFQPSNATLFLATRPPNAPPQRIRSITPVCRSRGAGAIFAGDDGASCGDDEEEDCIDIDRLIGAARDLSREPEATPEELAAVYELRGHEARKLLKRALSRTGVAPAPGSPRLVV